MQKKILVIDDSETNILLIKSLFEDEELIHVDVLLNSRLALKRIEEVMPDLILLDIMMPDIDGFTILTILKRDEQLKHIPVIVVSAKDEQTDIDRAYALGAENYITKPIIIDELFKIVYKNLNLSAK